MPDFPTFISAFFGTLTIGVGYIGLWLKYKIDNKDFYKIKAFDKTIQSLIIGLISFIITLSFFTLTPETISNEQQLMNFLLGKRFIIIINFIVVFYIVIFWVLSIDLTKKFYNIKKLRKNLKDFWKKSNGVNSNKLKPSIKSKRKIKSS